MEKAIWISADMLENEKVIKWNRRQKYKILEMLELYKEGMLFQDGDRVNILGEFADDPDLQYLCQYFSLVGPDKGH